MDELDRQVERGALFTHTALGEAFRRLEETEAFLFGLIDVLLAGGLVSEADLESAVEQVRVAARNDEDVVRPGGAVALVTPDSDPPPPAVVDCGARMAVCHAVCCRLGFALTVPEIEAGVAKWDLGHPYFIRQDADGRCSHNDGKTGACGIYRDRPTVCRGYSCAADERIWSDFDAMVLNTAWIEEHLKPSGPVAMMVGPTPVSIGPSRGRPAGA